MASAPVHAAVGDALATAWPYTPIRLPNDGTGSPPATGEAILDLEFPIGDEEQASIGSPGADIWRETGAARFVLWVPIGTGLGEWSARLDDLRRAFRGKLLGEVRMRAATPPIPFGPDDAGAFNLFSFSVAYEFDLVG